MAEWKRVKLGDVADIFTGYPFESSRYTGHPDAVRLLRGDNVVQGTLRWDGVKRWPPSAVTDEMTKYALQEGDVVLAMDRPWIEAGLKYASIGSADVPALLVQRVARLRPRAGVQAGFLKYVVGSKSFTEHVLAVQTGTAVPHISMGQIKSYEFLLPSVDHQNAVVALLGALDDKIGLNRRMCATLDDLHRALFANLESDLEFSESACTVGDVAQLVRKGVEPMTTPDRTFLHFSLPAFDSDSSPCVSVVLQSSATSSSCRTEASSCRSSTRALSVCGFRVFAAMTSPSVPRSSWFSRRRDGPHARFFMVFSRARAFVRRSARR